MDAFVIKTKRQNEKKAKKKEKAENLKQVKIDSLKRVVVIEEIERVNDVLENIADTDAIQNALKKLKHVKPSKEILLKTKIGHKINRLRTHHDAEIRKLATEVFKEWRKFYKDQKFRPTIEVRCDAKTELLRMKARKLIANSLKLEVTSSLSEVMEREIFKHTKMSVNQLYKRRIRKLCFKLNNESIKNDIINGQNQFESLTDII